MIDMSVVARVRLVFKTLRALNEETGCRFEDVLEGTNDKIIFPDGQKISFDYRTVDIDALVANIRMYVGMIQGRRYSENLCKKILINNRYGSLDG